ncbi:type II secretion system F family protein [Salsuginibacillus kocurii]|uniref:type II secretion system F family protein n=1 Tax=Salsuginibacillus kocurii TaxID=427078 RepID=UPI0003821B12|nr:type II secretion system F family protein [Salsuginibacillus kocurii]
MTVLLVVSIFVTCFFVLLAISAVTSSNRRPEEEQGIEEEEINEKAKERQPLKLGIKDRLKDANEKLKLLLVRKGKANEKNLRLERSLSLAGLPLKAEEFKVFQVFAFLIIGGIVYLILDMVAIALIAGLAGYMAPRVWLKQKQAKRLKEFNEMLPDMLVTISGSLRAGFSFPQSLQMVAEESYSPVKEEVAQVLKEMQYGSSLEEALNAWKERLPSGDLELLVEALLIQRQVGGNLAFLLDKIVETTREREKIDNQVKTLTAQGRLSGIIISLLPFGLGIIIYMINPEYMMTLFTHPIGQFMLGMALVSGVIGMVLVRKITQIEV